MCEILEPRPKYDGFIRTFFKNLKNCKTLIHTDEITLKKRVTHTCIPLWNAKKNALTIFRSPPSKIAMIMRLVLKTHDFFLEYFMVMK